jgi:hypothetical protein
MGKITECGALYPEQHETGKTCSMKEETRNTSNILVGNTGKELLGDRV